MRSHPILALLLWMGAGVVWVCPVRSRPAVPAVASATLGRPTSNGIALHGGSHETSAASRPAVQPVVALETQPVQPAVDRSVKTVAISQAKTAGLEQNHSAMLTASRTVRMLVTAYCTCKICCEDWSGFAKTSIGKNARICDGVAADPKLLPYHTRLDIPGIGLREVDDTGGRMRQDAKRGIAHIDVRVASHQVARKFGVQWLDVKVLK